MGQYRRPHEYRARIVGDIVEVPLTKGYVAIIDASDLALVEGVPWQAQPSARTVYAAANGRRRLGLPALRLHRVVLGLGPSDPAVDHIDGDGLNNRRSNLRLAGDRQNAANRRITAAGTSAYRGVYWHRRDRRWIAKVAGSHHLGSFHSEIEAARAYDEAAKRRWGEFAVTNFP